MRVRGRTSRPATAVAVVVVVLLTVCVGGGASAVAASRDVDEDRRLPPGRRPEPPQSQRRRAGSGGGVRYRYDPPSQTAGAGAVSNCTAVHQFAVQTLHYGNELPVTKRHGTCSSTPSAASG